MGRRSISRTGGVSGSWGAGWNRSTATAGEDGGGRGAARSGARRGAQNRVAIAPEKCARAECRTQGRRAWGAKRCRDRDREVRSGFLAARADSSRAQRRGAGRDGVQGSARLAAAPVDCWGTPLGRYYPAAGCRWRMPAAPQFPAGTARMGNRGRLEPPPFACLVWSTPTPNPPNRVRQGPLGPTSSPAFSGRA